MEVIMIIHLSNGIQQSCVVLNGVSPRRAFKRIWFPESCHSIFKWKQWAWCFHVSRSAAGHATACGLPRGPWCCDRCWCSVAPCHTLTLEALSAGTVLHRRVFCYTLTLYRHSRRNFVSRSTDVWSPQWGTFRALLVVNQLVPFQLLKKRLKINWLRSSGAEEVTNFLAIAFWENIWRPVKVCCIQVQDHGFHLRTLRTIIPHHVFHKRSERQRLLWTCAVGPAVLSVI